MSNVIELKRILDLAEKNGAFLHRDPETDYENVIGVEFSLFELKAFYDAAQKEQIEKDSKICAMQIRHGNYMVDRDANQCAKEIRSQLVKQND